jgi:hypothetical protein
MSFSSAGFTLGSLSFRGAPQAIGFPWGISMKLVHPRFRPSSFQSVPENPFFLDSRAARVDFVAVAFCASGESP